MFILICELCFIKVAIATKVCITEAFKIANQLIPLWAIVIYRSYVMII